MRTDETCSDRRSLARLLACAAFAAFALHGAAAVAADVCESTQKACDAVEKGKLACHDAKGVVASGRPECVSDSKVTDSRRRRSPEGCRANQGGKLEGRRF